MATTYNSDGSLSGNNTPTGSVQYIVTSLAAEGDTVTIPAGTHTWNYVLSVPKNITLKGASMFDGGTVITGSGGSLVGPGTGRFVEWNTTSSAHTAILRDIKFNIDNSVSRGGCMIRWCGTATVRYNSGTSAWEGGFRMTQCRFACTTSGAIPYPVVTNDWITGVIDHCWWDFPIGQASFGVIDFNHSSAPGHVTDDVAINDGGLIYKPQYGQRSFSLPYVWGGGPGVNGSADAIYMEDNLCCKSKNLGIASADGGIGTGTGQGGSRIVVRHNSQWCICGGHGFGETGNNAGMFFFECYNNFQKAPEATNSTPHNTRSGITVSFNERREGPFGNVAVTVVPTFNRLVSKGGPGAMVGPGDGTNFFDLNSRRSPLKLGALGVINESSPTFTFPVETLPSDTRIGATYGHGTGAIQALGGAPTFTPSTTIDLVDYQIGALANRFVGFTLRNKTTSGAESLGGQYGTKLGTDPPTCTVVVASGAAGPTGTVRLTVAAGPDFNFRILDTDEWELRYIEKLLGGPGGTLIPCMNGGDVGNHALAGYPEFLASKLVDTGAGPVPVNIYWCDQEETGLWEWNVEYRVNSGTSWIDCDMNNTWLTRLILGGTHSDAVMPAFASTEISSPTPAQLRIGADPAFWGSIGTTAFGGPISIEYNDATGHGATQAWGAPYPHPLVQAPAAQAVILLSGPGLVFGNVPIGTAPTATLTCTNTGSITLHVVSVTSNNGKFVLSSTAGFNLAPTFSQNITVTYTPTTETTDNCVITFDSDAGSGIETIAASGTGVLASGGGGKGKGHKKGVLIVRGMG